MAHFIGYLQGNRGSVSRLGHKNIKVEATGWDLGVKVYGYKNDDSTDEFHIYQTGGSNGATSDKLIKIIKEKK